MHLLKNRPPFKEENSKKIHLKTQVIHPKEKISEPEKKFQ
jgi:hypothetical protein